MECFNKGLFFHLLYFVEARGQGGGSWGKGWFTCRLSSEIEWTDIEAIVTSEDAIAHLRRQVVGDSFLGSTEFYREVRHASVCIDHIGLHDRPSRAGLDAQGAASAEIGGRLVGVEF